MRSVIVAGAGRGIGRAVAARFAKAGDHVVVMARSAVELEETQASLRGMAGKSICVSGDVGVEADVARVVARAVEAFGGVDVLVNSAGVARLSAMEEMTPE